MEQKKNTFERKKGPYELLLEQLRSIAERVNAELAEKHGVENFLDASGTVAAEAFRGSKGFEDEVIDADNEEVRNAQLSAAAADDPNVLAYFKSQGFDTPEKIIAQRKKEQERSKSGQMEMLATVLFHKAFGDDFFVARASEYDDRVHGIDNVLIDKRTGKIVCAFDEVHDHAQSARAQKKLEKIKKIARKGGTAFTYGIVMENGKFKRASVEHLPVFRVSLHTKELEHALEELQHAGGAFSASEKNMCSQFVGSLLEQADMFASEYLPRPVRENLLYAREMILRMREILSKSNISEINEHKK